MRQITSLPEPKEFGFKWRPFEKARKKLDHVEGKHKEVRRRGDLLPGLWTTADLRGGGGA
jgi:hypothetical protein